jgi:hypothetical protein
MVVSRKLSSCPDAGFNMDVLFVLEVQAFLSIPLTLSEFIQHAIFIYYQNA